MTFMQTDAQDKWLWKSKSKIRQIWKQKVRFCVYFFTIS